MKVGDLIAWEYEQFTRQGTVYQGKLNGIIVEIKPSVKSHSGEKCLRIFFQEKDVFGVSEQYDMWLYESEVEELSVISE